MQVIYYAIMPYNKSYLKTHSGSLEIIPEDMEVMPSLMVKTGAPVFRTPTTSSSVISNKKKGLACRHTNREGIMIQHWYKLFLIPFKPNVAFLTVLLFLNICLGR